MKIAHLAIALLLAVLPACKGPALIPGKATPSPAPALRAASTATTTAAKSIDDESASITGAVGWLAQVVAGLPADLQATTQAKIDGLAATAAHLSAIAATLRIDVAAPVSKGASDADAQAAQSKDLLKRLADETKRADAAELRERESFAASLRGWAIAAAVIGTLALAGAGWLIFSGNLKGAMGIGAAGLTLYGGAAALNFLAQYWMWIGLACGLAVAGLAVYIIWSRIRQEHYKLALEAIVPAVQEAGAAVRPLIAQVAEKSGTTHIVEKVVTDIKHATG